MTVAQPRTILMTSDSVGGVWTYSLELARALGARGVRVVIASMGRKLSEDQRAEVLTVPHLQVYESEYKLEWMPEPWEDVREAGKWLLALENDIQPDVIHLNGYAHGNLPWTAPVLVVGHSCVVSWWSAVHGAEPPAEWGEYRRRVAAGLRAAGMIVAPSAAMLKCLQENYGPLPPGFVIANGRSLPPVAHVRKEGFIFSAGRVWDGAKNIAALDAIAAELPWPVFVAGEESVPPSKGARRLGRLSSSDIYTWLARASIYAMPARYEPFGLSILEAALSRCALVLGDIPSLRENWDGSAVFVPPDDPGKIRSELLRLIECPHEVSALAQRAAATARRFSLRNMAEDYIAAYHWLRHRQPGATRSHASRKAAEVFAT